MTADTRLSVGRVLFVTHNVPRFEGDAAGSFVLRLAVALRAIGVQVDVLAPGSPELQGHGVIEGVPIERVRYAVKSRMTLAYTGTMAEDVKASWGARFALLGLLLNIRKSIRARVKGAVRDGSPYDVVHAHWWFPSGLAAYVAGAGKSLGIPLVVTMHGSDVRLAQGINASHGIMRRVLTRARITTAVSRWLASSAKAIVPRAQIEVGPMPVETSIFVPPRAGTLRSGALFVGRLNAQKGLADLLTAFARVESKTATLDVVGAGPEEVLLKRSAQALGIADRVTWHGALKQHEVVALYQRAAVVAMPSRNEGLGLVAVEAQLCETPVIGYASGGLVDVVLAEQGGTLTTPGDIAALTNALNQFLGDTPAIQTRIAACGLVARRAMLDTFSPDAVAEKYVGWYREALSAR